MVIVSPLMIGLWHPFQMGISWLINGGDPNHLLTGMILQWSFLFDYKDFRITAHTPLKYIIFLTWAAGKTQYNWGALWDIGIVFRSSQNGLEPLSSKKSASQEDSYMKSLDGFSHGLWYGYLQQPKTTYY